MDMMVDLVEDGGQVASSWIETQTDGKAQKETGEAKYTLHIVEKIRPLVRKEVADQIKALGPNEEIKGTKIEL